jgi:Ca-activated chloride channel homolog
MSPSDAARSLSLPTILLGALLLAAAQAAAQSPAAPPAAQGSDQAAPRTAEPRAAIDPAADPDAARWRRVVAWPEMQRAFFQDGPGWLLDDAQRTALLAMDEAGRAAWIADFLARDPLPATPRNELADGIAARRAAMLAEVGSPLDVRARLLFLHGPPVERTVLDCALTFVPLEVWSWGPILDDQRAGEVRSVVFYQDADAGRWRLWLPQDGKRVLYTRQMEGWLEDWERLGGRGQRIDRRACRQARLVDRVTGVYGLAAARRDRPLAADFLAYLAPPADLGAWAAQAAATAAPTPPLLELGDLEVRFPAAQGQRITTRWILDVPAGAAEPARRDRRLAVGADAREAGFDGDEGRAAPSAAGEGGTGERVDDAAGGEPATPASDPADPADLADPADPADAGERELRLVVEGAIERDGVVHERFRVRFRPDVPQEARPTALVLDRPLRVGGPYLVRLAVRDEVSGRVGRVAGAFVVPAEANPDDADPPSADEGRIVVAIALAEDVARDGVPAADHLLLVPPEETVVLGLWRAQALVSGSRIARVEFLVDGEVQLTRSRPPYTAELRLDRFPREQVVAAAGYDAAGELVAADEVVVNQPRGSLRVRIVEPVGGVAASGSTRVRAEVTVPDGRRVERLELAVNDRPVATLERPPWEADVELPSGDEVAYLAATVTLDDGARAEDVRVLNAPGFGERLDVALVELYVAAVDGAGRPLAGLAAGDFRVLEDGRPQEVRRFEEVRDLPLAVGLVLDTSGSMQESLVEAQQAAQSFLRSVVRPGDTTFAIAFSDQPSLLVPPTDDVDAVAGALAGLRAHGGTALHDAMVTSLYYFRGLEGQKALVLLSDGDDTASSVPYADLLEYARQVNVAVYSVGLRIGLGDFSARRKLAELARATGGQSFFVSRASELDQVYDVIEEELRSRYLLAFSSDRARGGGFRTIEVEVARSGVTGRTIRGYVP